MAAFLNVRQKFVVFDANFLFFVTLFLDIFVVCVYVQRYVKFNSVINSLNLVFVLSC